MTSRFILIGGAIGSGKTSLAYGLKPYLPDLVIVESDMVRRELLGYPLDFNMNGDTRDICYSEEMNTRVYNEMDNRIRHALDAGKTVIECTAKPHSPKIQQSQENHGRNADAFFGIFLKTSEDIVRARLKQRSAERVLNQSLSVEKGHASDADETVLAFMPVPEQAPEGWLTIDASQPRDAVVKHAWAYISRPV